MHKLILVSFLLAVAAVAPSVTAEEGYVQCTYDWYWTPADAVEIDEDHPRYPVFVDVNAPVRCYY